MATAALAGFALASDALDAPFQELGTLACLATGLLYFALAVVGLVRPDSAGRGRAVRSPPCCSWSASPTCCSSTAGPTRAGRSSSTSSTPVLVLVDVGRRPGRPGRWWWPLSWALLPVALLRLPPVRRARRLRRPRPVRPGLRPDPGRAARAHRSASAYLASPLCGSDSRRTIAIYRDRSLTVGRGRRGRHDMQDKGFNRQWARHFDDAVEPAPGWLARQLGRWPLGPARTAGAAAVGGRPLRPRPGRAAAARAARPPRRRPGRHPRRARRGADERLPGDLPDRRAHPGRVEAEPRARSTRPSRSSRTRG